MPGTVLVIDDENVVVDITRRKLTQEGFSVIGVNDGEAAIQVLKEGRVDIIVLDVEMPKMNGYTFMTERKKVPGGDSAPVIVLTAYESMQPIFQRHGVSAYLTKPIRFQELFATILKVLSDQVSADLSKTASLSDPQP